MIFRLQCCWSVVLSHAVVFLRPSWKTTRRTVFAESKLPYCQSISISSRDIWFITSAGRGVLLGGGLCRRGVCRMSYTRHCDHWSLLVGWFGRSFVWSSLWFPQKYKVQFSWSFAQMLIISLFPEVKVKVQGQNRRNYKSEAVVIARPWFKTFSLNWAIWQTGAISAWNMTFDKFKHGRRCSVNFGGRHFLPENMCMKN